MTLSIKKKTLRKVVSSLTMLATVVSMSGIMALSTVNIATAAVVDGSLIKSNATNPDGSPTYASLDVYIVKLVGTKMFKRLMLNPTVFESYGHLNWGDIQTVSQAVMDTYTTSALVRVDTDPAEKVFAMAPDGDIGSKSWVNLTTDQFVTEAGSDADSIYTINAVDGGNYTAVGDVTTVAELTTFYTAGTLPGVVPVPSGALTVALSASTPASGTLISGTTTAQAGADLMHFTLTGTGTVTGVALKRIGVSADATLSNVYLFDGATRITDAASVSTGSIINFNNISGLTVSGSKTISVKSDILAASSGQTVGVQLTGVTMTSGVVGGTLPISGNVMSIASATLATVVLTSATGSGNSDPSIGLLVWQGTATVGTRDVLLTRLALRQVGSIVSADINNFKLLVDGTEVATAASLDSNGYATFTMSKALASGSRTLKVTADVIGGSGRTVQLSLRAAYDISTTDTQYGAGVTTTGTFPFGPAAFTVNSGSMTVVKATGSQSTNLTVGASDQSLATYTMTAFGEPIKVETLKVGILGTITTQAITDVTLRNVKIMVNGSQVGSTTDVPAAASFAANEGTQFTTNFTVAPGTPATVEIRGDMVDTTDATETPTQIDSIANGKMTAVQAVLVGGTGRNNGVPQVTITAVNVPTDVNVLGNSLTIASGSISIAKTTNYGTQTIVTPQTAFKIGSYVLTGNATEAVNLNTIYVGWSADGVNNNTSTPATDLTTLYVTYDGISTTPKGTVSSTATNGNSWSISKTLAVNQALTIDVYATIGTTLSANNIVTTLAVAGTTALSGITVYADGTVNTALDAGFTGQVITGGTGTIVATTDASTPASALIDDSGTVTTAAFKFAATNDSYTITNLTVTITDPSSVATVKLMDGITPVVGGEKAANATVTYSGLNIPVTANQSKTITVQLVMSPVASGAGLTGGALLTTLTAATAKNSGGTNSTPTGLPQAGNAMYVYKAFPIITNVALPTSLLVGGGNIVTLAKFTVSSSGGAIAWSKLLATVTESIAANSTFTLPTLWDVTSGSAVQVAADGSFITDLVNASGSITIIPNAEQQISGSKTYELRATLTAVVAVNDTVTTQITQPSSFVASLKAFAMGTQATTIALAYFDVGNTGAVAVGNVRKTSTPVYTGALAVTGETTPITPSTLTSLTKFGTTAIPTLVVTKPATSGSWTVNTGWTVTTGTVTTRTTAPTVYTHTTSGAVVTISAGNYTAGDAAVITVTLSEGTALAANTTVLSAASDIGIALTAGVAPASSFVWSDISAASHAITTADWTNAFLVQGLPNNTQNLLK